MAEFEGAKALEQVKAIAAIPHAGTGDVKYHYGAEGLFTTPDGDADQGAPVSEPEPPRVRGPGGDRGRRAPRRPRTPGPAWTTSPALAVPLLLHGDAAFPGQGVVAETLNLQSLEGYSTGGTVHIITDNQVGFTTDPEEARSTPYACDMAKGFNVPIIHVNADDVEACIAAIRLAMAYRERWGRDMVIDLIGYRRYGHNETDEPAYTQPMMAAQIKAPPAGLRDLRGAAGQGGGGHPRGGRGRGQGAPRRAPANPQGAEAQDRGGRVRGPDLDPGRAPASSTAPRAPRSTPPSPRSACAR